MPDIYDYAPVIKETRRQLSENPEWRERYREYAKIIGTNEDFIRANRARFYERELKLYLNTTNAKKAVNEVVFEMRFLGQNVAKLTCTSDKLTISTKGYEASNKEHFGCGIELADCAWISRDASAFRTYFKNHSGIRNESKKKNDEHRYESLLLTEFSKPTSKALSNIKPVMLAGLRYPMPTPLKASEHDTIKYSGIYGGGIDILTRTGIGKGTNLCIMELKDENVPSEPAADALKQAIIYTVFIRELLKSESGAEWWKLFGFGGSVPKKLVLFAACVMPDIKDRDTSFEGQIYDIDGDLIKLHYLYFQANEKEITSVITSLKGKTRT